MDRMPDISMPEVENNAIDNSFEVPDEMCDDNINNNVKYMRHIAPHANPNRLMVSLFEKNLGHSPKYFSYPFLTIFNSGLILIYSLTNSLSKNGTLISNP